MSSVRDFGARGDGRADDTEALEHAVRHVSDGLLEFPRGDFLIRRTIEVRLREHGRLSLSGLGGVGRVVMAGPGPAFRFVGTHTHNADPGTFAAAVWEKERMPQVQGLEVVGAHPEADGIEFVRVMQPTLLGVLIREVRHGVRLTERNRNLLLGSCHVYNCRGAGVLFDRVNLHSEQEGGALELYRCRETGLVGCQVFAPKHRGIFVADSRNTRIADCTVVDRAGGSMRAAVEVVGEAPGTLIRGNILGKGSRGDILAPGAVLEGNHLAAS